MRKTKAPKKYVEEVTEWASSCEAVIALALVGSHARNKAGPDSDIDFILLCDNTSHLINNLSWIKQFGKIRSYQLEEWGVVTSIRVIYIDGQEIEFGIAPLSWASIPIDAGTSRVVTDGIKILKDKRRIVSTLKGAVAKKNVSE